MSRTLDVAAAFVLGAVAGSVAALLLAPEKGETTRKQLKDGAEQLVKRGEVFANKIQGAATEAVEAARHETRKQVERLAGYRKNASADSEQSAAV